MVILLGGPSCSGKTLIAQQLLEIYKISYLSLDHLKMGLYRGAIDCGFEPTDPDNAIAEKLWPIVKGIIMTCVENKQHIIIEGCYVLPHLIKEFEQMYLDEIVSVFIVFSNKYIKENYTSGIIGFRSVIESRLYDEDRAISYFVDEHSSIKEHCELYNIKYIEIKENYELEITKVFDFIAESEKLMRNKSV